MDPPHNNTALTVLVAGRDYPRTYREFVQMYPDDVACAAWLEQLRWPSGFVYPGFGRLRMRHIPDASGAHLVPFVRAVVAPGSTVLTDGWSGYIDLPKHGYTRDKTILSSSGEPAHVCRIVARIVGTTGPLDIAEQWIRDGFVRIVGTTEPLDIAEQAPRIAPRTVA